MIEVKADWLAIGTEKARKLNNVGDEFKLCHQHKIMRVGGRTSQCSDNKFLLYPRTPGDFLALKCLQAIEPS